MRISLLPSMLSTTVLAALCQAAACQAATYQELPSPSAGDQSPARPILLAQVQGTKVPGMVDSPQLQRTSSPPGGAPTPSRTGAPGPNLNTPYSFPPGFQPNNRRMVLPPVPASPSNLTGGATGADLRGPINNEQGTAPSDNGTAGTPAAGSPAAGTPAAESTTTTTSATSTTESSAGVPDLLTGEVEPPVLKGAANMSSLSASAQSLVAPPLPKMRDTEMKYVQVSLRNDSQQIAVVNGDAAQGSVQNEKRPAAGGRYLTDSAKPHLTKQKIALAAAAEIGSAGLAGPLFYEYITPDQHRKRSLGTAIGVDGARHQVESDRFGVRVIMPGDETAGWMAFPCPADQSVTSVSIPISFSRSLTPDGVLEVPVGSGSASTSTTRIDATTTSTTTTITSPSSTGGDLPPVAPKLTPVIHGQ